MSNKPPALVETALVKHAVLEGFSRRAGNSALPAPSNCFSRKEFLGMYLYVLKEDMHDMGAPASARTYYKKSGCEVLSNTIKPN